MAAAFIITFARDVVSFVSHWVFLCLWNTVLYTKSTIGTLVLIIALADGGAWLWKKVKSIEWRPRSSPVPRIDDAAAEQRINGFRLMALPAELRLQILRYSVGIAEPIDQRMFHDFQSTIAATTMVCKQLRTESEELFYGNNIFISRFIPTQRSLQQFFREPRKYSDLEHRYLRQDTPYPFPHRIRPTIRHLELVLGVPRPRELTTAVKIWMSPITALESDGYTRLESLKISFRLTADFMEPTLKPAERAAMQQAARKFVAGQKISAKTVYIDWTGLQ